LSSVHIIDDLFLILGIHADSYRAVVDKFNLHVSSELSCPYRLADGLRELGAEGFVEWDRVLMRASLEP
jgi:hypothetical protein